MDDHSLPLALGLAFLLWCLLLAALTAGLLAWAVTSPLRKTRNWRTFAAENGLAFRPARGWMGQPRLEGTWQGVRVEVRLFHQVSRQLKHTLHTRVAAWPKAALPAGLGVRRERLLAGLDQLAGAPDILLGDPGVDRQFVIQGEDPEAVRAFLRPGPARDVIADFVRTLDGSVIADSLVVARLGHVADPDHLRVLLDAVVEAAKALDEALGAGRG